MSSSTRWINFGKVGRTHSYDGRFHLTIDPQVFLFPDHLNQIKNLKTVRVSLKDKAIETRLVKKAGTNLSWVLAVDAWKSAEAVKEWTHALLAAPREEFPPLLTRDVEKAFEDESTWIPLSCWGDSPTLMTGDLLQAEIVGMDGAPLGWVSSIENFGAGPILFCSNPDKPKLRLGVAWSQVGFLRLRKSPAYVLGIKLVGVVAEDLADYWGP